MTWPLWIAGGVAAPFRSSPEGDPAMNWPTLDDGRMLVLRTNAPDGKSHGGFQWPHEVGATAAAPDWKPGADIECSNGLHGLLWGCGAAGLLHDPWSLETVWLVVAVDPADIATPIDGTPDKVRFRACEIVHVGDRESATALLVASAPGLPVVYSTLTGGNYSTLTGGYHSTLTGGDHSTLTGGDCSTLTGGDHSTLTGGDCSTLTGGDYSTLTGGYGSTLICTFYDTATRRYRRKVGEVDGTTLKANTPYRVINGEWVEAP